MRRDNTHVARIESRRFATADGVQVSRSVLKKSSRDRETPFRTRRGPVDGERELVPALEATEEIEFRDKMTDAGDAFGDQYYLVPA
jgi:hypothetical protein